MDKLQLYPKRSWLESLLYSTWTRSKNKIIFTNTFAKIFLEKNHYHLEIFGAQLVFFCSVKNRYVVSWKVIVLPLAIRFFSVIWIQQLLIKNNADKWQMIGQCKKKVLGNYDIIFRKNNIPTCIAIQKQNCFLLHFCAICVLPFAHTWSFFLFKIFLLKIKSVKRIFVIYVLWCLEIHSF